MNDEELLVAAAKGDAAGVRDALQGGAALEARDSRGRTPLLLAAAADHVESAEVLVKAGADPDARDFQRDTAFLVTGSTGSVAMLRALLPAGPDPSLTNRHGEVALIPACARGHAAYVREVLRLAPMEVDHAGRSGRTGLLEAIVSGDGSRPYREIVRLLAEAGADVNLADGDGVSALRHALDAGQEEMAALLRDHGAR